MRRSKRNRKENRLDKDCGEISPEIFNNSLYFGYMNQDYKRIRYGSWKNLKEEVEKIGKMKEWGKLNPECVRILLLYYYQDKYEKENKIVRGDKSRERIDKRIKELELNSLGDLGALVDHPYVVNPDTGGKIGKKKLRMIRRFEKDQEKRRKVESEKVGVEVTGDIQTLLKEKETASPERARKIRQILRAKGYFISKIKGGE